MLTAQLKQQIFQAAKDQMIGFVRDENMTRTFDVLERTMVALRPYPMSMEDEIRTYADQMVSKLRSLMAHSVGNVHTYHDL